MFDIIQKVGRNNWVFGVYYIYRNRWKVSFSKNIHGNVEFVLYDNIFIELEKKSFLTKKELKRYCEKTIKEEISS